MKLWFYLFDLLQFGCKPKMCQQWDGLIHANNTRVSRPCNSSVTLQLLVVHRYQRLYRVLNFSFSSSIRYAE